MKKSLLFLIVIFSLACSIIYMPRPAFAEDGDGSGGNKPAVRTIMLYICGSNLETPGGMASYNLRQILNAKFGQSDDVRVIVMTGGAKRWTTESKYLCDPKGIGEQDDKGNTIISKTYNQIWEAKGANAAENASKLVLLKADGVRGTETAPVKSVDELMSDPETLKAFINYCATNFPAQKYDLILWDHGGGPTGGYAADAHNKDKTGERMMQLSGIMEAISHNQVTDSDGNGEPDGKFDFIDFDACLMSSLELNMTLADYMDYYIASPQVEPGYGQDYSQWLNTLGENPAYDTYELGKIMVNSFIDFYTNGEGAGDYGTLSIVNTKALLESGIIGAVQDLNTELLRQSRSKTDGEYLFYDEMDSADGSIEYEQEGSYDLGNFAGQLAVSKKETAKEQDPAANPYLEPAKAILKVLGNKDIIYGRGTEGIHAAAQFFLNQDGKLQYEDQFTSGMYVYFPPETNPQGAAEYCNDIGNAIEKLPIAAENDGRKALLQQLRQVAANYGLIMETGYAVSVLANQENMDEASIGYESVKTYWVNHKDSEGTHNEWSQIIKPLLDMIGGEEGNLQWLEEVIKQQAAEVLTAEEATAYTISNTKDTKGLRVVLSGTNKRIIKGASMDFTAEIPAVEEYIEKNNYLVPFKEQIMNSPLGGFQAEKNMDDLEFSDLACPEKMLEDYLNWYKSGTSSWDYPVAEDKWYAIQDAAGSCHVASVKFGEKTLAVPVQFMDEEDTEQTAVLIFKKSVKGYVFEQIIFNEFDGWRPVKASELKESLNDVMTINQVSIFQGFKENVPMSKTSFDINPDNIENIKLVYLPTSQIKDIENLHRTYVVKDIYDNIIDISKQAENPAGELINIEQVKINPVFYNGKGQEPIVTYKDQALTAGNDYTLYKLSDKKEFIEPGKYLVTLHGKGRFCGITNITFTILMTKEQAEEALITAQAAVEEAKETVAAAEEAVRAAIATGNTEKMAKAYQDLITAQQSLAAAQETLDEIKDNLNKAEQALINDKINSLEQTVKNLKEQLAAITKNLDTVKAGNTLAIKGKQVTVKYKKLKKKAQTREITKTITFTKEGQGEKTYKLISAKKGKKSFKKKFKINTKTGKLTIGKKLKKGTYKVKIKVKATGNATYKASEWKTATIKVKVK